MDPADVAREDLRSYALRRCIRFYAALLLFLMAQLAFLLFGLSGHKDEEMAQAVGGLAGAGVLAVLVAVELASGVVMAQIARAVPADAEGLWRFARGPGPSWVAAAFFAALSGWLAYQVSTVF